MSEATAAPATRVYLVGAGPGDPELLTLKAARLLAAAEVVLHDALIDTRVLALAPQARLIDVGKRSGRPSIKQRFINRVLVSAARRHGCVVRLKGGDPGLFGRLDEETRALRSARIAFEVVPGITAACAAAASLGVSLTLRGTARSVTFATPRTLHGTAVALPVGVVGATRDTLVVYMAGEMLSALVAQWMAQGRAGSTPLAVVESASLPQERPWAGTLASAADWPGPQHGGPVLVMLGEALAGLAPARVPFTGATQAAA